jgi:Ca2+-binding RTX toxin-like protein/subtilisin-like proprotein convertase family protein
MNSKGRTNRRYRHWSKTNLSFELLEDRRVLAVGVIDFDLAVGTITFIGDLDDTFEDSLTLGVAGGFLTHNATVGNYLNNTDVDPGIGVAQFAMVGGTLIRVVTADEIDSVTLNDLTVDTFVDSGNGDDIIDASGVTAANVTVLGGQGDDILTGADALSPFGDRLEGGDGDDILAGLSGDDRLFGDDGRDQLFGDDGNDVLEGGADEDNISMGTGIDEVDAGSGKDTLNFEGAPGEFFISRLGTNVIINAAGDGSSTGLFGAANIEQVLVSEASPGGASQFTVQDLSGTPVNAIGIELTSGLANDDELIILGSAVDDSIVASLGSPFDFFVSVPAVHVRWGIVAFGIADAVQTNVRIEGLAGNDLIEINVALAGINATLIGSEGDDILKGGSGNDTLIGGAAADTLVDSPGNDTYDGGTGTDTILIRGTDINDLIDLFQPAPGANAADNYALTVINATFPPVGATTTEQITKTNVAQAPNNSANQPTVERVRIEALAGDDNIRVGHSDTYSDTNNANGIAAQNLTYQVQGDSPNASDRLVVRDDGPGDLVIQRLGADQRSGSFVVGGMAPIDYDAIEFAEIVPLNVITGGTGTDGLGRLVVFKNDVLESNNSLATSWFLGSDVAVNADPTIDPAGFDFPPAGPDPFDVLGDTDFFQFVAQETGTLDFQIYFDPIASVGAAGALRPGLPGNGELIVTVFDSDGMPMPVGTATPILDMDTGMAVKIGERIHIPVVRNNRYFLRVTGETADAINVYNFTATNIAAPIPQLVDMQTASDSGRHNSDDITNNRFATFDIILDDDRIDEFMNLNLVPDTVNDDAQTQMSGAGMRIDYGVEVFNNAVSIGFAFYTSVGNTWQFTANNFDLMEGSNNFISAAVWIRDPTLPIAQAAIGRHELSMPLQVTLDLTPPPKSFGLPNVDNDGLTASSDSGVVTMPMTFSDRITRDTRPRLWGTAEADTAVKVYLDVNGDMIIDAGDILIGQTVATSLDGNNAFPGGRWELSTQLDLNQIFGTRDGLRRLLLTGEDVAGNANTLANGQQIGHTLVGPQPIADNAHTNLVINVPDIGTILDMNVEFDIRHPSDADLDVVLMGPDGTVVTLFTDVGAAIANFVATVLDDDASNDIGAGAAPFTGNFNLEKAALLSVFNGRQTAGNWTLMVSDDSAGNVGELLRCSLVFTTDETKLDIFVDTQGPQVTNVQMADNLDHDLFDPKPIANGYTPLVRALKLTLQDLPARLDQEGTVNDFLHEAIKADIAGAFGNYLLVGDHVGTIAIETIDVMLLPTTNGNPATAMVTLKFVAPLPDDRYTLTVRDNLVDPSGNKLDGESNAVEPLETPFFPSGDGVPGGNFVVRFTIDSRPEIGSFVSQAINLDINGNYVWDPTSAPIGNDTTNVDLSFTLPAFENGSAIAGNLSPHELLVARKFRPINGQDGNGGDGGNDAANQRYFDQLATYGNYNGVFRWLIDLDSDGVVFGDGDPDGVNDLIVNQGTLANFNGFAIGGASPIAGNFDRNAANGDEIGLYNSGLWAIDTNHDYNIDTVLSGNLLGHPIVGDFDGNGTDDFAVFNNNVFSFGFNLVPNKSTEIIWGFPGVLDRPVAGDMDQDGIDDIGLWVPRNSANPPRIVAEWYFRVSNTFNVEIQALNFNTVNRLNHGFSPVPFGADLYAEFGEELALPIVGNFDPPVATAGTDGGVDLPGDYDGSGTVDMADKQVWRASFGSSSNLAADGNRDGRVDTADYVIWRNNLDKTAGSTAALIIAGATTKPVSALLAVGNTTPSARIPIHSEFSFVAAEFETTKTRKAGVDDLFAKLGSYEAARPKFVPSPAAAFAPNDSSLLRTLTTRSNPRATGVAVSDDHSDEQVTDVLDEAITDLEPLEPLSAIFSHL